ncbi:MAG: plasmid pRiA4b ORF-3 family protein [Verrucomicrobiales bacterium]|nr:plasmid pRiA4b ORF-3 family protein [Verrucomicrobiales bacterium]
MIYTLTIDCVYGAYLKQTCRRVIEIDERTTTYGLHLAIQKAVRFENDHPFEFYAARAERSRPRFPVGPEAIDLIFGGLPTENLEGQLGLALGFREKQPSPQHLAALNWAVQMAKLDDPALCEIYPIPERLKLFYWFDFGDDWKFEIKKARAAKSPARGVRYPKVIEQVGPNPKQYPNLDAL